MLRLVQSTNSLDVNEDIIRPAKILRQIAKCDREATKLLLQGLEYSPDNEDILREIEQAPNSKAVLLETGQMHLAEGDVVKAKKIFKRTLDMHPDDFSASFELAKMEYEDQRRDLRRKIRNLHQSNGNKRPVLRKAV